MKRFFAILSALVVVMGLVACLSARAEGEGAEGKAKKKEHKEMTPPPMVDLTVTGMVTKEEVPGKEGKTMEKIVLTQADGSKVSFRQGGKPADKNAPPPPKIEDYVGKNVRVTGKGMEKEKKGVKTIYMMQITTIDEVVPATE